MNVKVDLFSNQIFTPTLSFMLLLTLYREINMGLLDKCYFYTYFWFKFVSGTITL